MRDLICDVIKLLASNWYVGKISEYDKIVIENWKKRKRGNQRTVYHVWFRNGIHNLLRRTDVEEIIDIMFYLTAIRSQIVPRMEYLYQAIVLGWHFNTTRI